MLIKLNLNRKFKKYIQYNVYQLYLNKKKVISKKKKRGISVPVLQRGKPEIRKAVYLNHTAS